MKKKLEIETPDGMGVLEEQWISELGYHMIRVKFDNRRVNYNMGIHDTHNNMLTNQLKKIKR